MLYCLWQGKLPEKLVSRVLPPSEGHGRGRRPSAMMQQVMSQGDFVYPNMTMGALAGLTPSMMSNYPKMAMSMPFGTLPGLGLANPMYSLAGFGMMGGATSMNAEDKEENKAKDSDNESDDGAQSSSSTKPHPSFPFMYNPMMFNPMFTQASLGNFTLPMGLPTSFASLAQHAQAQQMVNGMKDSDDEEPQTLAERSETEQDLVAEDLSVKRKTSQEKISAQGSAVGEVDDKPTNLVIKDRHKEKRKEKARIDFHKLHKEALPKSTAGPQASVARKDKGEVQVSTSSQDKTKPKETLMSKESFVKELASRVKEKKKKSKLDSIISGIVAKVGERKEEKSKVQKPEDRADEAPSEETKAAVTDVKDSTKDQKEEVTEADTS